MMQKVGKLLLVITIIVMLTFSFVLMSCSKHPSDEQLKALEETKKAALAAEDQLAAKKQEKANLERELAEKKQKLEEQKKEKEKVKSRLENEPK